MDNRGYEKGAIENKIDLRNYWAVVLKRKWIIIFFALIVFATVTIGTYMSKPVYTATGTLLIEKDANILSFQDVLQIETFNDDYYQTQYKLLLSRALANDTIERLKLYENGKFTGKIKKASVATEDADIDFRGQLIDSFLRRVAVNPVAQTRLVEVSFKDPDRKFAADVVNALFDSFIDMNIQKKYQATEQATEFLTAQIAHVKAEIEGNEKKLQEYGAQKNIFVLSDKETTIVEKLGGLNRALTEAQIDRVQKETSYNEIKMISPDYIPAAINNQLIQNLREDYVKLSREYLKNEERFRPDYPEMQRLKTELESAKASLANETQNLIKAAESDYQAALGKERSLQGVFNQQKQEAIQLNSNAILYNSLKIEIENKKDLLELLLKRESETGVSARLKGLRTSNVWIVDRAAIPRDPSSPKKRLNMILALMIGLFGGLGLAFLFEYIDNSVKSFQDVEKYTGLSPLGFIPAFSQNGYRKSLAKGKRQKGTLVEVKIMNSRKTEEADPGSWLLDGINIEKKEDGEPGISKDTEKIEEEMPDIKSIELITHFSPESNISENYRSIRTTLLLSSADSKLKYLVVSSPLPEEGKTATNANLAVTFAQAGKKVLIVDADLRKPRQHRIFKIKNINGLTNYLSGDVELKQLVKATQVSNLWLINSGPVPPNPVELLSSEKMAGLIDYLKQYFDYIFFDTPPLLPVSDAVVLGPKTDGLIIVVWGGKTTRDALKRTKEKLDIHNIRCAGVIINNINLDEHDYYYMKHYYHYYGKQ